MAKIIEQRVVNERIQCTLSLDAGGVYIPVGIYGRTLFMKKNDGTVMECRVKEAGHCLVETEEGKTEQRGCVRYETPEGAFVDYSRYASDGLVLYSSYEDAVRCRNGRQALIQYKVDYAVKHLYECVWVTKMFQGMGFEQFKWVGTWNDLLEVYGWTYENGHLHMHLIKSTMWVDKDGLHIEPIIPEGVFKTREEAYASNKPKLVTFDDADEDDEDFAERRRNEFHDFVAHHCPGFEDKIDWMYFQNLDSDANNLAEQVRVWSNK